VLVFSKVIESKPFDLPQGGRLLTCAKSIEAAMKSETTADARRARTEFLDAASEFYKAPACGIRFLPARPLRVRESWSTELFGGCHEFCQHLGIQARRAAGSRGRPIDEAISPILSNGQLQSDPEPISHSHFHGSVEMVCDH
jgi:hypothetical protein